MNPTAMKKMGTFMTISMGITVSAVLATVGVATSGHFNVVLWGASVTLSIIIALVIGFLIPIRKVSEKITANIKSPIGKMLVDTLVVNLFYCLIITVVLEYLMVGLANKQISARQEDLREQIITLEQQDAEEHKQEIIALQNQIDGMEQNRPEFLEEIPIGLVRSFIIAYIVCLFVQPIYKAIGVKRYFRKQ